MVEKKPYIVSAEKISEKAYALEIYHPLIARNFKPGQFATVQASPESARIPLQIVDTDPEKETFWVVVRAYNRPTLELIEIFAQEGMELFNVEGPNGSPFPVKNYGSVLLIGNGWGTAANYPILKALKEEGNNLTAVIIGETEEDLYCIEDYQEILSKEKVWIYTENGEKGFKGNGRDALENFIEKEGKAPDLVVYAGKTVEAKMIAEYTREKGIKNLSLVPTPMLCTSGLCMTCRVKVGDKWLLNCLEGPYLDGNLVDWQNVILRNGYYWDLEKESLEYFTKKLLNKLKRKYSIKG